MYIYICIYMYIYMHAYTYIDIDIVIIEALCFDVAQGRMNGAHNETYI